MTRLERADARRFLTRENLETALARIHGLESEERVEAWLEVEDDLGGRRSIVAALNRRRTELRDQPDDYPRQIDRPDSSDTRFVWIGPDGERYPEAERPTSASVDRDPMTEAGLT